MHSSRVISCRVLLARFSSSFVHLRPQNESCAGGKSFPLITFVWYYRPQLPLGAWQSIWARVTHGDTVAPWPMGVRQRGSFFNASFHPAGIPVPSLVKLKRHPKLTARSLPFIIITSCNLIGVICFSCMIEHQWKEMDIYRKFIQLEWLRIFYMSTAWIHFAMIFGKDKNIV